MTDAADDRSMATVPSFSSLLYREPHLYDLVFPDAGEVTATMVRTAMDRYLSAPPRSMLDVGCGTGRHLEAMARTIPECYGVDLLESNIAYAKSVRPRLTFHGADMRTVRLGRTFDVITCLGNALSYALTDQDLADTVRTFASHAHPGTLLALDVLNARAYLEGDGFVARMEGRVAAPQFRAAWVSVHALDRAARRLTRTRTWRIEGRPDVQDHAEYRLLLPDEVRDLLQRDGFRVLGMYDNREFQPTTLAGRTTAEPDAGGMRGRKLYVFACRD
jgi:SAM-dependent methyltransferase